MKKSKKMDISHAKEATRGKKMLFSSLFGALIGLGTLLMLIVIMGSICLLVNNPHPLILPLSLAAIYVSSIVAGLFAVKLNGSSDALLCGTLCGVIMTLFAWIIFSIIGKIFGVSSQGILSLFSKLFMVIASIGGGFLGLYKIKGRKKF